MIYLATPLSHPDWLVCQERWHEASRIAARLMEDGKHVFSPIVHCYPIAAKGKLPTDFGFWATFDTWFLERCDEVYVVKMEGWDKSKGIAAEVDIARQLGIKVSYWKWIDGELRLA